MAVIANLDIILGAKTEKLDVGVGKAGKQFTDLKKQLTGLNLKDVDLSLSKGLLGNGLAKITGLISGINPAAMAAAAGTAVLAGGVAALNAAVDIGIRLWQTWVAPQFEAVDVLAKQADVLGLTVGQMQAYNNAAEMAGLEQETFKKGLVSLNKQVEEAANGSKQATELFGRMGLAADKLAQLSPDERLRAVSVALSQMNQQQKLVAAGDLFGSKGGAGFLALIGSGPDQLDAATATLRTFGLELSRVDAAKIEDANDRLTELKQIASGLGGLVAVEVSPAIAALAETIFDLLAVGKDGDLGSGFRELGQTLVVVGAVGVEVFGQWLGYINQVYGQVMLLTGEMEAGARAINESQRLLSGDFGADFVKRVHENNAIAAAEAEERARNNFNTQDQDAAAKEANKLAESIGSVTGKLEAQVAMFGQSSSAMQIYELRQQGATDAQLDMAMQMAQQLDALEAGKKAAEENAKALAKLEQEGAAVFKATRTPLEEYEQKLADLGRLFGAGAIDQQTFGRAVKEAQADLKSGVGLKEDTELAKFAGLAGAMSRGSATAFKASQQNSREDLMSRLTANSKKQIEIAEQQRRALDRIARDIHNLTPLEVVK